MNPKHLIIALIVLGFLFISFLANAADIAKTVYALIDCGALSQVESIWNKQNGHTEIGEELEKDSLAYLATAKDIGLSEGLTMSTLNDIYKTSSNKYVQDMKQNGMDGLAKSVNAKNAACLNLIKQNPKLNQIWAGYFNQ